LTCEEALDEHVGHGNMYVSRYCTPPAARFLIEVQTLVSTEPTEVYPRGMANLYVLAKQLADEVDTVVLMSTPYTELLGGEGTGAGTGREKQH